MNEIELLKYRIRMLRKALQPFAKYGEMMEEGNLAADDDLIREHFTSQDETIPAPRVRDCLLAYYVYSGEND